MNSKEAGRQRFSIENVIGDPFVLVTVSVSILAWLIAFVSSAVSNAKAPFPHFAWWTVVYMLFCILGVTVVFLSNSASTYHVAIVGFLSAGLVFTTSAVNTLIYDTAPYKEAAGAGHILLSMVAIIWIFYFGSQPQARSRSYVDSFALNKGSTVRASAFNGLQGQNDRRNTISQHTPQMYSSAHLNGLETTSPTATGFNTSQNQLSQPRLAAMQQQQPPPTTVYNTNPPTLAASEAGVTAPSTVGGDNAPIEYPYKAKAIYSYEANPEDSNEISFTKHEILEVSDISGRWWQARKENGETGIAPSNYLILL